LLGFVRGGIFFGDLVGLVLADAVESVVELVLEGAFEAEEELGDAGFVEQAFEALGEEDSWVAVGGDLGLAVDLGVQDFGFEGEEAEGLDVEPGGGVLEVGFDVFIGW
jgi:hypothetical protein